MSELMPDIRVRYAGWTLANGCERPKWFVTLNRAIKALDPFQTAIHWPAHNVGNYLGRIAVWQNELDRRHGWTGPVHTDDCDGCGYCSGAFIDLMDTPVDEVVLCTYQDPGDENDCK